jgi:exopolysaccharide biosynthesis polyprenyl glycosylphosphotransferase
MLPVYSVLLRGRGLYEPRRGFTRTREARQLVEVVSLASLALAATPFFLRQLAVSRLVVGICWVLACVGLVVFRGILRETLAQIRARGYNLRRVLIVGTGPLAGEVYTRFESQPETGFKVVGFAGLAPRDMPAGWPPILGSVLEVASLVEDHGIDQVVIAVDRSEPLDPSKLMHELQNTTAGLRVVPDLQGLPNVRAGIENFDGLPVIRLVESPLLGWGRVQKRSLDVVVSGLALAGLAPLMLGVALAIRLTSPGAPALFRQRRMGLDGRLFQILKFRTMIPDAEADTGPIWAGPEDPRRTKIGPGLRRWNLDELPQLWNVLRGEMSLVGPRPERPEFIEQFRKQLPGYMVRHKVKAGMTGWAQVNGWRGQTSIEKRLEHDIEYVRRWSIWFDLEILVRTFVGGFRDPNAY